MKQENNIEIKRKDENENGLYHFIHCHTFDRNNKDTPRCYFGFKSSSFLPKYTCSASLLHPKQSWSDKKTYRKWFCNPLLPYLWRNTNNKVILIMDHCGPHSDRIIDHFGQDQNAFRPPNFTLINQPLEMVIFVWVKWKSRYVLFHKMPELIDRHIKWKILNQRNL